MTTNQSVGRSNAPQETATDSGYVGLQAIVSTVGLVANKYIALNREWNITGNYAVRMHKTLKHQCVHYTTRVSLVNIRLLPFQHQITSNFYATGSYKLNQGWATN